MLFLLKIAISPFLVAAVSVAARWWGPTVGGILMGLPWFTGPTLFLLDPGQGHRLWRVGLCRHRARRRVRGRLHPGYGLVSIVARWPLCLAGGVAAFAASALAAQHPALLAGVARGATGPLWVASGVGLVALAIALLLLPRPTATPASQALPWWDIPI